MGSLRDPSQEGRQDALRMDGRTMQRRADESCTEATERTAASTQAEAKTIGALRKATNDSWPETRRTLDRLPDPRRLLACWVAAIEAFGPACCRWLNAKHLAIQCRFGLNHRIVSSRRQTR